MNNAIIPQAKRRPGRPRKSVNISNFNKLTTYTPRDNFAPKRKATEDASDEIEIVGYNGFDSSHPKKAKPDDIQPTRSQPPRRARFTESYGGNAADVVVISDEEQNEDSESDSDSDCGPIPSPVMKVKTPEELGKWEENIQTLKKALSDEEMKLVLLRKLQESQKTKDPKREAAGSPAPVAIAAKTSSITLKGGVQIQPLPSKQLLTSNKYLTAKKDVKQETPASRSLPKSSSSSFKPIQPPAKPTSNSPISLTVPKSVEPLNSNHLNQYPLLKNLSNQITITAVPPAAASPSTSSKHEEKVDTETLQQRQAAAKLALRKQLEKTLLQIPLPKPPPLKINFFPMANSIEFLCLLGLDYVVDCLTKSKKNSPSKVPLTCAQCSTDFTCTWKWKEVDKNGKKAYDAYCEACINSNIRKALKAQHTNNLKSAFLKALQQEKEIDRLSLNALPKSHSSNREVRPSPRLPAPSPAHQVNTSSSFSIPKVGTTMPYIPKAPQGLNHTAALAQLSKLSPQYQSLFHAQVQAQQLLAGVPLHSSVLSLTPFVTQSSNHGRGKSSTGQSDNRRQRYRADRVQSTSIPQASSSWKA